MCYSAIDKKSLISAFRLSQISAASHRTRRLQVFYHHRNQRNTRDIAGSYTLQIHLISTINSGNARLWICTMVLANTGLPEKTSWRHLTLPCSEGCIHICHKQQLIYDVIHRCAVLCQHLLDVCVGLAHLRLHISPTNYIAPYRHGSPARRHRWYCQLWPPDNNHTLSPGHTKGLSLFTDRHFASFRVTGSKK